MGTHSIGFDEVLSAAGPQSNPQRSALRISSAACHPSEVTGPGCLFVCMDEYLEYNRWQTWRSHLEALPALGLAAVVAPERIEGLEIPQFLTPEPRKVLGRICRLLHRQPDERMQVYGVTGTNGKTTTTRMLAHLLQELGEPCGSIGTLGLKLGGCLDRPGTYTTPLANALYAGLDELSEAGAAAVAMEVSSHALALDRVEGIAFAGAVLTNVERDHLDFHGTEEAYAEAKGRLFARVRPAGWCVLNRHSPQYGPYSRLASGRLVSYGQAGSGADLELLGHDLQATHSDFQIRFGGQHWEFRTRLVGRFQIENAMAAITLLAAQGYSGEAMAAALASFPPVTGRMERFTLPNGCTAIVDYAHNPDGLKNLLENCRMLCRGRLHVVFGCGGDRDRGKRPLMGRLAAEFADCCWVTSDNPRTEEPSAIIRDILEGMAAAREIRTLPDREEAIRSACAETREGDVLVVAGKGHEDYQIIGFTKHPFSDQAAIRQLGGR